MGMNLDNFIDTEVPEINKEIDTVAADTPLKTDLSLLDMIKEKPKVTKKMTPVYLDEETIIKLKSVAYKNSLSVANVLETTIKQLTKDIELDKKTAEKYDKQIKGNRGKRRANV